MRVYKRGDVYWFELQFKGERIQRSTKSKNQRTAGQIASAYHTALIKGEVGVVDRKPVPKFKAAMKAFLEWSVQEHAAHPGTAERSRYSSMPLLKFFRDTSLENISPDEAERYKKHRLAMKSRQSGEFLRPATVNRELACLREMFNHAIKAHPELRNPVSKIKLLDEENLQDRVLTVEEQWKYLEHASPVLRDVAMLILETGMRPEEVFTLQPSNIDPGLTFLRIFRGKTKAAKRRIELSPTARTILERRVSAAGDGYLFQNKRRPKEPLESVQSAHTRALSLSKLAPFRPYDLRHTWATRAAEAGIDLVTLAAMMGHSRIQMVLRYAHPTQDHQTNAMDKLVEHNAAQEKKARAKAELEKQSKTGARMYIVPRTA